MSANMNDINNELTHDRIQAEIAKLIAETAKINKELKNSDTLTAKLQAETAKINKEMKDSDTLTAKLQAETIKLNSEARNMDERTRYQWLFAGSAITLAIGTIFKLFL